MTNLLFKISYWAFLTALVAVGMLLIASLLPIPGNIEIKIVQSGSMEPAIKTGSVVIIKPTETYAVGDIITFGKDTKTEVPTTHRIIAKEEVSGGTLYTTKGDANEERDATQSFAGDIIGKVLVDIPYVGFILDFARKPIGFAFLVGIPASVIVLDELANIWKEVQKMMRRKKVATTPSRTLKKNTWQQKDSREVPQTPAGAYHNVLDLRDCLK